MTVFDVYVNDRKCCRAGVGPDGVLTATATWVKLTGAAATRARRLRQPVEESRLHVGGLARDTHYSWLERALATGDKVSLVVGTARAADPPRRQYPRAPKAATPPETAFLNVDLDIRSSVPLEPLVEALGRSVFALYVGRERRYHVAHLEAAAVSDNPDRLIRRFVALIRRLPRAERRLWNKAQLREFNVGIEASRSAGPYELHLAPATIRAAASVDAGVGITIYGAAAVHRSEGA